MRFDYHCVFDDDTNVVIEMQQWYKLDIVKRFYLYHAVQASLQLEDLAQKLIFPQGSVQEDIKIPKESKTQDYSAVIPTITLIWLVEESFGFEGIPYINYVLQNENIDRFLFDPLLKDISKKEILDKIEEFKNISKNTNKDLDFLKKNKLCFYFQANIVSLGSEKSGINKDLFKWFKFTARTADKNNKEADFMEFLQEAHFKKLVNRLQYTLLGDDDKEYILEEEEFLEMQQRYAHGLRAEVKKEE